jgi:hypothetical protein
MHTREHEATVVEGRDCPRNGARADATSAMHNPERHREALPPQKAKLRSGRAP